jgi:hypothetical protein
MHSAFRFETFAEKLAKAALGNWQPVSRGAASDSVPKMEMQQISLSPEESGQASLIQHDASMGAI